MIVMFISEFQNQIFLAIFLTILKLFIFFDDIFNLIQQFLFKTVKPKDVFFLAVDGVAPRAKMNQQRARRFKYLCLTQSTI